METISVCPSTLAEGFDTYTPAARKLLFDGREVSHILPFDSPNNESADTVEYARHVGRISLSGVQPKASLVLDGGNQLVRRAVSMWLPMAANTSRRILHRLGD